MDLQAPQGSPVVPVTAERRAQLLLMGLSFFLGLAFSLLYAVANSLFLVQFGSSHLPVTYVAIALVVPLFSYLFSALQRRWTFPSVALATMAFFMLLFVAAWLGLRVLGAQWLSFSLVVGYTLGGLLCGLVRGALAGFIFDARTLKRMYPLILAAEILGVILGGLSVSLIVPLLGRVEHVLLVGGSAMAVAVLVTGRIGVVFREALVQPRGRERSASTARPRSRLSRNSYVLLVLAFQVLFSMTTRLVDYLFLQQARARFTTPESLTGFLGTMMALATVLTFLFVVALAGRLLTRFGMRLGLVGNSLGVGTLVVLVAVSGTVAGPGAAPFFWLIVGAEFLHYILKTGLSETSVRSAYQPLPPGQRTSCQTLVEGVGIPIAYGLSGTCLLVIGWLRIFQPIHVVYFTVLVIGFWAAAGLALRRSYGEKIRESMRRRLFDSDDSMPLTDRSNLEVAEALLGSDEDREVNHALEFLEKAGHPALERHLARLVGDGRPEVRLNALSVVERRKAAGALPAVRALLGRDLDARTRAAAIAALSAVNGPEVEEVRSYLSCPEASARDAALVGLFRHGGIQGALEAAETFGAMARSREVADSLRLARLVGEIGSRDFYQPIIPLLEHESVEVRREALVAAGKVASAPLWPAVVASLRDPRLRPTAMFALRSAGDDLLPVLEQALGPDGDRDRRTARGLIRACAASRGGRIVELLARFMDHPDRQLQRDILEGLHQCGFRAGRRRAEVERVLIGQVGEAAEILAARLDLGDAPDVALLAHALDGELAGTRRRIFLLLSFVHDARAVLGAERKLRAGRAADRGLALELLDVVLSRELKVQVFGLFDEHVPLERRLRGLGERFGLTSRSREERVRELAGGAGRWRSGWVRACGLYVAARMGLREIEPAAVAALDSDEELVRETAIWALCSIAPAASRGHLSRMRADPSPRVAAMAAQWLA